MGNISVGWGEACQESGQGHSAAVQVAPEAPA